MTKLNVVKVPIPKVLDAIVLEAMAEPLQVQITRIKANVHTPIPMPQGEQGEASGSGYTKAEVRQLNDGWIARDWAGGGNYQITVIDASQPPNTYTWQSWYSPTEYGPERSPGTPPVAPPQNVQAQPQPAQVNTMAAFPNGLPTLPPGYYGQPSPAPQYYPQYVPQGYTPNYNAPSYNAGSAADFERRRYEERLAQAETQLRQAQLDAQKRDYDAQLERERASNAQAVQRLEAKLAELMQQMQMQANARPHVNPEIEAVKEQNRMLVAERDSERREREMERRERETREHVAALKQSIDAQIAAMNVNMQQLVANAGNKSDPILQLVLQQGRDSIAAMERIASQSSNAIEKLGTTMQTSMLNPRDIMSITREASQSSDSTVNKLTAAYENVMALNTKVFENAMNLNQGGSPVVDLVREGVHGVKEMAEKYLTTSSRAKQVEAQANAQVEQARAQASAIQSQANAAIAHANARGPMQQQPNQPVHQPRQAGLAGQPPQSADTFAEWQKKRDAEMVVTPQQPRDTANAAPQPTPTSPAATTVRGRTDIDWFGPALGEVLETRKQVRIFLGELAKAQAGKEAKITEESATPDNVANGIWAAWGVVAEQKLPIPAMVELLFNGKYDEFVEVLLPGTPEGFREHVVLGIRKLNGEIEEPTESDDDDDGEGEGNADADGSPADNVQDGSSTPEPQKPKIRVIHPNSPARA